MCFESWLNPDEGIYVIAASKESVQAILQAAVPHAHPPLFYLILAAFKTVGIDYPSYLRLVSVVAWLLMGGLMVSMALLASGRRAALVVAALVLLSPATEVLSSVVRPYALNNLFLTLGVLGWWWWLKIKDPRALVCSQVGFSLAVLTHYSSAVVWGAVALTMCLGATLRRCSFAEFSRWVKTQLPVALALFLAGTSNLVFAVKNPTLDGFVESVWRDLFPQNRVELEQAALGAFDYAFFPGAGAGVAIFVGVLVSFGLFSKQISVFSVSAAVPVLFVAHAVLGVSGLYPFGASRHMYHLLPVLLPLLLEAVAFAERSTWRGVVLGMLGAASLYGISFGPRSSSLAQLAVEHATSRECVRDALVRVSGAVYTGRKVFMDGQTAQALRPYISSRHRESELGKLSSALRDPAAVEFLPVYCLDSQGVLSVQAKGGGLILSMDWCRRGVALPHAEGRVPCGVSLVMIP
jgi:hypothetical protein